MHVRLILSALVCVLVAGCGGSSGGPSTGAAAPPPSTASTPSTDPAGNPATGDGSGGVKLTELGTFDSPVYLAQPQGERELYVVEQTGKIRVIGADGKVRPQPFLDVTGDIVSGGEQGLLSMAFSPDYAKS